MHSRVLTRPRCLPIVNPKRCLALGEGEVGHGPTWQSMARQHVLARFVANVMRKNRAGPWIAAAILLAFGLAGCAAERGPMASDSDAEAAPYIGVFTGEFVDGKPLYRFPVIHVVGSRNSIAPGM